MMVALYLLLTLAAMALAGYVSPARGRPLATALLALAWVVGQFNTLIEAVVFSVMPLREALVPMGVMLVVLALFAALAVTILGRWRGAGSATVALRATPLRLLGVIAAYIVLYFTAGTIAWPHLAHFYTPEMLPPQWLVALLQVPRALIFVAAAWLWLRTGPRAAPLVLGLAFSVIGGIAPLLPENPYMPGDVRLVHAIEVGTSNFLFGIVLAWLIGPVRGAASAR
ncbi:MULTISPECIES: hypothetical protein [unclassified Sphingomonas]|uniref:hypothetical protein n=1 Tax=unclassified Sphingomonas TaxID=196159 RepID=UPI002151B5F5|nr:MULTISPECIES: hypothetical protein [unclassified Sphingomonas]MCR5871073.1 hypothetical protein [Sphingomonas sp. J344]UUY00609.1 hypothetical protein LRS08_05870 [Sphingomonas sp. J315]